MAHAETKLTESELNQLVSKLRRQGYQESDDWHGLQEREYAIRTRGGNDMLSNEQYYDINIE